MQNLNEHETEANFNTELSKTPRKTTRYKSYWKIIDESITKCADKHHGKNDNKKEHKEIISKTIKKR